jgi:dihydrofolate synthase/folylpolyglutamate synthase
LKDLKIFPQYGFAGRWQLINESPLTIVDAGHNESGIGFVVEQLQEMKFEKLHFVFGMVNDKDISNVLKLLPKMQIIISARLISHARSIKMN